MNETIEIQTYIEGNGNPSERLLTEARLLLDPAKRDTLMWQQRVQEVIRAYRRAQISQEIKQLEQRLFTESRFEVFKNTILNIFKK